MWSASSDDVICSRFGVTDPVWESTHLKQSAWSEAEKGIFLQDVKDEPHNFFDVYCQWLLVMSKLQGLNLIPNYHLPFAP